LPTNLPLRRQVDEKPSLARTVFDFLFNTVLVVSALILTFIVLVREEQYAFGQQGSQVPAIEQTALQSPPDGGHWVIPPSN
jgi:hypothetical protein